MVLKEYIFFISLILLSDAPRKATPAPGKVIFEVEQNIIGKSSELFFLHSSIIFKSFSDLSEKL